MRPASSQGQPPASVGPSSGLLWTAVTFWLRRRLPRPHQASTIGDLAEDFARYRCEHSWPRSTAWLVREASSLARAYRAADQLTRVPLRATWRVDAGFAWRRLYSAPGAAALAALLTALGIALVTTMFSVIDSTLLQPAPFRDADRLVRQNLARTEPEVMRAWLDTGLFESVEAAGVTTFQYGSDGATSWPGASLTPGMFRQLGVAPILGRVFESVSAPGAPDEVVLSERIWRSTFGSDTAIVGRRIEFQDRPAIVVGVMPASFRFPVPDTLAWRPLDLSSGQRMVGIYGQLKVGVPRAEGEARVLTFRPLMHLPANFYGSPPTSPVGGRLPDAFTTKALWLLLGGAGLVFVALVSNAAALLIVRLAARRRTLMISMALGASQSRLVKQTALEHAAIGAVGLALGVLLAERTIGALPAVFVDLTLNPIDLDARALAVACGLGALTIVFAGIVPAWRGTSTTHVAAERATATLAGRRYLRAHGRLLLLTQVALASCLLVGSLLLVRSFVNMASTDRGFVPDGVVRLNLMEMDEAYGSYEAMAAGAAEIVERLSSRPEVRSVSLSREIPPSGGYELQVHSDGAAPSAIGFTVHRYRVDERFFPIYGVTLIRGRLFTRHEFDDSVIVSRRLANALWPGADPLGRTFFVGSGPRALATPRRVVGIVSDVQLPVLDPTADRPEFYTPLGRESRTLFVNLRCDGSCPNEGTLRSIVRDVHPQLGARLAPPAEAAYIRATELPRAVANVSSVFALVGVVAVAGGLFGALTQGVQRRRREFGVRLAIGAQPRSIAALIVAESVGLVVTGMAIGAVGAWSAANALGSFHYGVTALDPVTWMTMVTTLVCTALAAAWRPALQARRIDPVQLLREEQS